MPYYKIELDEEDLEWLKNDMKEANESVPDEIYVRVYNALFDAEEIEQ